MGPITLFDKSFLQALNVDEAVLFDHFFLSVICPIFYVETLADLEKAVREGRTPEQEVGVIAEKTPQISGTPCQHHEQMCLANLLGYDVPMKGRIPVAGGRPVSVEGKKGVVFEVAPEREAFNRWQARRFLEVERRFARAWRSSLAPIDPSAIEAAAPWAKFDLKSCKSIEDVYKVASEWVVAKENPFDRLRMLFLFLNIPNDYLPGVMARWESEEKPLREFAPYAAYVLTVELFLHIGVLTKQIAGERASNRQDIAYLCYLPFSMVFVSSDKLHRRCAPLFLRPNQEFVWGLDLKADLTTINDKFLQEFSPEKREAGLDKVIPDPPDGPYLTAQLWDRHLGKWRERRSKPIELSPEAEKKIVERMKRFTKAATSQEGMPTSQEEVEVISMARSVQRKRGSWWQVPKDLPEPVDD